MRRPPQRMDAMTPRLPVQPPPWRRPNFHPTARPPSVPAQALAGGLLAATSSAAALLWRSRRDAGRPVAGINAISHWLWPRRALHQDAPSWKHTGSGTAIHYLSSLLWSSVYAAARRARRRRTAADALVDAAVVSAAAAVVDFRLTPQRLTPGFEHRVGRTSLAWIYGSFALGLAAAELWALRRR